MFVDSNKTLAEIEADLKASKKPSKKRSTAAAHAKHMVVDAADIKSIEGVNEIPEGADYAEGGVEIAGDSPVVDEFLNGLGD